MLPKRRILVPSSSRESGELSSHGHAGTRSAADWISAHSEKTWGSVALGKLQTQKTKPLILKAELLTATTVDPFSLGKLVPETLNP